MSTFDPLLDLSNQLCYVQCSFCNTILLVSVPCNSLLKAEVTVICGHCQSLLRVKIGRSSFVPLQLVASPHQDDNMNEGCDNLAPSKSYINGFSMGSLTSTVNAVGGEDRENDDGDEEEEEEEEEESIPTSVVVNKPPEKRQRAPSAYNRFIREEIKRIKARQANISHKEAFSTAAKNWAHIPRNQQKEDVESCSHGKGKTW